MVEERQAELRRQQEEAERAEKSAQEELEPPPLGAYLSLCRRPCTQTNYNSFTSCSPPHTLAMHPFSRRTRYDCSPQVPAGQVSPTNDLRRIAHLHDQHVRARRRRLDRALHEAAKKESDDDGAQATPATQIRDRGRAVQDDSGCPRGGVRVPPRGSRTGRVRD
jgi:hypothetical protein